MTFLAYLFIALAAFVLAELVSRFAPSAGSELLYQPPPEVVAWREEQDRRAAAADRADRESGGAA